MAERSSPLVVGLSGSARNACLTLCEPHHVIGICPQERITRVRGAGFNPTGLPDETLDELLRRAGRSRSDVATYAVTDMGSGPQHCNTVRLEHHFAHACSAFLPSPFEDGIVLVCDHEPPHVSVWAGSGTAVSRIDWPWHGDGFAELYSQFAEAVGFPGAEHRMEALARLNPSPSAAWAAALADLEEDRLKVSDDWRDRVAVALGSGSHAEQARVAASLQSRVGDLLVQFLAMVKRRAGSRGHLCLAGSLFYNSHFNARVKVSGLFDETFVPMDPGNSGLSLGAALHAGRLPRQPVSAFAGPSFGPDEIKATLDNCKLTYRWASETEITSLVVDALQAGRLVAWFEGAMESGPRALGGRSILASPFNRYVLDNLNRFLKQRDPWRGYALSGIGDSVLEHFEGPPSSPFMECDYLPKDRGKFQHVLPGQNAAVRVQTVGAECPPGFRALLGAFGESTGYPVLVNTSFNGFQEPIVCSPRDAVRVFFGSGIDMLVMGQFVLTK